MRVKGYLRYRRSMLSAAAVAFVVFPSIIWLAGAGMTTALYAAGIYAFILAVFIMIDIPRYSGKVKRLDYRGIELLDVVFLLGIVVGGVR